MDNQYAVVETATSLVVNTVVWDGEAEWSAPDGCVAILNDSMAAIGWKYISGTFHEPDPVILTDDEVCAINQALLQIKTNNSTYQKAMIENRIGTLQDAVSMGISTAEESSEYKQLELDLAAWKKYSVYLGRVSLHDSWPLEAEWPVQPW